MVRNGRKRVTYRCELGEKFSEGARQMWLRMRERKLSDSALAAKAGLDRGLIFRYRWGDSKPGRLHADKLRVALGIKPALFDADPLEQFVPPAPTHAAA